LKTRFVSVVELTGWILRCTGHVDVCFVWISNRRYFSWEKV